MNYFSIHNTAFTILGYAMSWLELLATVFTVACVWLAILKHILNWPVAIVAIILSFYLFFQSALYADCFLQIYFLITSIYGWWFWSKKTEAEEEQPVTSLSNKERIFWIAGIVFFSGISAYFMMHLNSWLPEYFPQPTAYPVPDSFIMISSFAGQWLLAKKKIENWYCWLAVNATAVIIYYLKDIKLFSLLYLVLFVMAVQGIMKWRIEKLYPAK